MSISPTVPVGAHIETFLTRKAERIEYNVELSDGYTNNKPIMLAEVMVEEPVAVAMKRNLCLIEIAVS